MKTFMIKTPSGSYLAATWEDVLGFKTITGIGHDEKQKEFETFFELTMTCS